MDIEILENSAGASIVTPPHSLDVKQVEAINNVVSTMPKYETTLNNLCKVALFLQDCKPAGITENSELNEAFNTIREIYTALLPTPGTGTFDRKHGIRGLWNGCGYNDYV